MKKHLFGLIALGLLMVTGVAYAQDVNVKVNIPFDFVVNQQTMPQGEYTVKSIGTPSSGFLSIRNADSSEQVMLLSHRCETTKAPEQPKLIFHRYGDRYFLAQVWTSGDLSGQELAKSRRESELAKGSPANDVSVAALR